MKRLCLLLLFAGCGNGARAPRSVVLVTVDTLRADRLGSYGGKAKTPVLDALAREGARFENVFAQSPLTLPSHSSILTGTYPTFHGVRDNGRFRLPEEMETLAEILKGRGYMTAAFVGGFPVDSRFGLDQGFDVYDDSFARSRSRVAFAERRGADVVAPARDWIASRGDEPYFLWVHLFDPHAPYNPPEPFPQGYEGEVAYVDSVLGNLLAVVPDNALVAVTADHGEGLGEHGEGTHSLFVYDSTLRVPWLLRGPGVAPETVVKDAVRSIDIAPTLLDLAGHREACSRCQGRAVSLALEGRSLPPEPSYAETYFPRLNLGWSELVSVRASGWKYIEAPEPELYDLSSDPGEARNLASSNPEKVREMASELARIEEENGAAAPAERTLDAETRAMLRSLGYLSSESAGSRENARPDPKSRLHVWEAVRGGMELVARGDVARAIVELEAAKRAEPDLILARTYLALAYLESGRYADAVEQAKEVLAREPLDFDATLLLGRGLLRLGSGAEARLALERAAALDEASADPWVELSQIHLSAGERSRAEAALNEAVKRDQKAPAVLLLQGKFAALAGSLPYAEKLFRAVVEASPSDVDARVQLGNLLLTEKRLEEAEEIYRQGIESRPEASDLHLGLGHSRALAGRVDEAIPLFEKALALSPDSVMALNSLAFAYLEMGEQAKAAELLRRSLALKPDQPDLKGVLQSR
jgi:arylsulfatase A-like enzyme/Flp pilus assembly protein TadD